MARPSNSTTITRLTPTLRTSAADAALPKHATSGRVAFDERGNAVWEMRTADHRYTREGSTTLVRKLHATPLSIEATGIVRRQAPMPASKPLAVPEQKRAVPAHTGRTPPVDRVQMGTVRTFPVRASAQPKRPVPRTSPSARGNPGLLGRLFGRKS